MSAESSQTSLRKVVSDGRSDPELLHMVRRHYDNEQLMRLQGEIHFAALSRAEVEVARQVYARPLPLHACPTPSSPDSSPTSGEELTNVGSVADLSPYHRERIRRRDDLGMLGEPDCFYRAVKM